jgi:DNA repair protein SbcD/Mre11
MIKLLHFSDIHLGSGFTHGKINPETGLNTRFEDFVSTMGRCIDRAISENVDLVLFGGDAFPDATPAPYIQQAFARQIHRLVEAQIPTVLLVGNHDQHSQGAGGASLCIYRTLGVPGVIVGDRLETHHLTTRSGPVQILTLPWLNRNTLMTKQETEALSMSEIGQMLLDRLRTALEGEIRQLDPEIPTILLGHLMADAASFGAERFLAVGKGFTVPLTFLTRDCFDYVALGHVHKHQVLCTKPPVIYPGSIERVDFSEEKEEKGFVMVNIEGRQSTTYEFCTLDVRRFVTIEINLCEAPDPQEILLKAIAKQSIENAIVRLNYQLRTEQIDKLDDNTVHQALTSAHRYFIESEVVTQKSRSRLPELQDSRMHPMDALKAYLQNREDLRDLELPILEAAQAMIANESPITVGSISKAIDDTNSKKTIPDTEQLRLL